MVRRRGASEKLRLTSWVCANSFGLWWSERLRAMMDSARPLPYLNLMVLQDLFPYQVQRAPDRPLCHFALTLADVVGLVSAVCRLQLPPSPRFQNGPERSRARAFCAAQRAHPLDGEDRSGTWVERERGLTSLHQPRLAPGIDTVGHGPRHARQFVGQRHNRYVLVGPG